MITQKICIEHEGNISDVKRDQWTWTGSPLGVKVLGWTNIKSLSINNLWFHFRFKFYNKSCYCLLDSKISKPIHSRSGSN